MFNKTISTNKTGDTSLKELCEQRGYIIQRIVHNLEMESDYDSDIDSGLKILLEKTEELIKQFKLKYG